MTAIYFQHTQNHALEYHLVELTTIRETYLQNYKQLERAIHEKRRPFNDESIFDCLRLLNQIRFATFDLFDQIIEWQKMYVRAKRPTLLNKDYLIEIITSTEFINSSKVRKYFNFALMRGNIFMLPLSTGKPKDVVIVNEAIMNEIQQFANPDMDRLISAYTLLQKSLPKQKFKDITSLNRWIYSIWMPNVSLPVSSVVVPRPRSAPTKKKMKSILKNTEPLIQSPNPSFISLNPQSQSTNDILLPDIIPKSVPPSSAPSILMSESPKKQKVTIKPSPNVLVEKINSLKSDEAKKPLSSPSRQKKSQVDRPSSPILDGTAKGRELTLTQVSSLQSITLPQMPMLSTVQLREWYLKNPQNQQSTS